MSFEDLLRLPRINGVTLIGNKRFEDFGLVPMSIDDITAIELEIFGYIL